MSEWSPWEQFEISTNLESGCYTIIELRKILCGLIISRVARSPYATQLFLEFLRDSNACAGKVSINKYRMGEGRDNSLPR